MSVRFDEEADQFVVEFQLRGTRVHRRCPQGTTRAQAEQLETRLRAEIFEQADLGKMPTVPLPAAMQMWLQESVTGRKAAKATNSHALALAEYVIGRTVTDIPLVADRYRQIGNLSAATINRRLCVLKAVAKFAYLKSWTRENLSSKIPLLPEHNQRHVYLQPDEIDALLAAFGDDERARAFAAIAVGTGMRQGEIAKLKRSQVSADFIDLGIDTKTGRPRRIPILDVVRPYLHFVPFTGSIYPLVGAFEKARKKAKLSHVRFHDLRHTTASLLAISGVDLGTIGRLLGHKSTQTTARYAHLSDPALSRAMGNLQSVLSPTSTPVAGGVLVGAGGQDGDGGEVKSLPEPPPRAGRKRVRRAAGSRRGAPFRRSDA